MDAERRVFAGDLLVRDGVIAALGEPRAVAANLGDGPVQRVDAAGALVTPGLVQGHLHLCQTLFRGLAEQSDLMAWLREAIWPLEAVHDARSVEASARLDLLELLAGGVTCINDMGTVRHTEATGSVLESVGIRATFGKALMTQGNGVPAALLDSPRTALDEARSLEARFHGTGRGRIRVALAPRFILSCGDDLWDEVSDASSSRGLPVHTHIAESPQEGREVLGAVGTSAARHFAARGVLSERFIGAHGVWLEQEELRLVRESDSALVHCPGSNLKLGSGLAAVRAWQALGIRSGLGSDGAACNNLLDPFREMALAAGVSRVRDPATPLPAADVVALATIEGARALGLQAQIGSLEIGKQADLAVVDVRSAHHGPDPGADPYATLVHSSRACDVRLTMVAGRVLYQEGAWTTLDPESVKANAASERRSLLRRAGAAGWRPLTRARGR